MERQVQGNTDSDSYAGSNDYAAATRPAESADERMRSIVAQLETALSRCDEIDPPMTTPDVGRAPQQVGLLAGINTAHDLAQTLNLRLNGLLSRIGRL